MVSLLLIISMLASLCFASFAETSTSLSTEQKAKLIEKAQEFADKYGLKMTVLSPEETAKCKLKYNSFEDFEKALEEQKAELPAGNKETSLSTEVVPSTYSTLATTTSRYYDNINRIDILYLYEGLIRNRLFVTVSWNYDDQTYHYLSVTSQSSYITELYNEGWTWQQLSESHGITDNGRTLWSHLWGRSTLTASFEGLGIGYSWDSEYYNEWYNTSTL